jgi:hypothetical protein
MVGIFPMDSKKPKYDSKYSYKPNNHSTHFIGNAGMVSRLGHYRFLPYPSLFIIISYHTIQRCTT